MQNKNLYRGKRKDTGEWIYGTPIQRADGTEYIIVSTIGAILKSEINNMTATAFVVIPGTVGQYTGIDDKNGRKLFEGDVISHSQGYVSRTVTSIGKIVFSKAYGAFIITGYTNGRADMFLANEMDRIEVIGNIHDNPEFLRGGESEET